MLPSEIIAVLEAEFGPRIKDKKLDALDPFVVVEPGNLVDVCRYLHDDSQLRFEMLNNISGVDYLEMDPKKAPKAGYDPHIEIVYHLQSITHRHRFTLKVILPRWKGDKPGELPEVPTLCEIWQSADWHEREVYDLIGIWFVGHPDPRRILCSEDWVGHPLRKDYEFPLEYHGIRGR